MTKPIELDLTMPGEARIFVEEWCKHFPSPSPPGFIDLASGRRILFAAMTDDEAVEAAHLLHDLDVLAAQHAAEKGTLQ